MSMTKKQARNKVEPLEKEIEELKEDLKLVKSSGAIFAISQAIENKNELLEMYKKHANS